MGMQVKLEKENGDILVLPAELALEGDDFSVDLPGDVIEGRDGRRNYRPLARLESRENVKVSGTIKDIDKDTADATARMIAGFLAGEKGVPMKLYRHVDSEWFMWVTLREFNKKYHVGHFRGSMFDLELTFRSDSPHWYYKDETEEEILVTAQPGANIRVSPQCSTYDPGLGLNGTANVMHEGPGWAYSTVEGWNSTNVGDRIRVEFYGTGILWYTYSTNNPRSVDIYLDGVFQETKVLMWTWSRQVGWSVEGLNAGQHVLEIVVSSITEGVVYNGIYSGVFDVLPNNQVLHNNIGTAPSNPRIFLLPQTRTFWHNFMGKTAGNTTVCAHVAYYKGTADPDAETPATMAAGTEFNDGFYRNLMVRNTQTVIVGSDADVYRPMMFSFNLKNIAAGVVAECLRGLQLDFFGSAVGYNEVNPGEYVETCEYMIKLWDTVASAWSVADLENEGVGGPEFSRASVGYDGYGQECYEQQPRFTRGYFHNLLTENQSSVESDTTGFTPVNDAVLTRVTDEYYQGTAALKVETPGNAGKREGVELNPQVTNPSSGSTYYGSAWVKGEAGVYLNIYLIDGAASLSENRVQMTGDWQRIKAPAEAVDNAIGMRILSDEGTATTFYVDALQISLYDTGWVLGGTGKAISICGETTNLLTENQSSVETDTSGFAARNGATLSRDTSCSWHGNACLKIVTDGATSDEGFYTTDTAVTPDTAYTGSVYVRGTGTVILTLEELDSGSGYIDGTDSSPLVLSPTWQKLSVTHTTSSNGAYMRLMVRTNSLQAITFYADGMQIEEKAYMTDWHLGGATRANESLVLPAAAVVPEKGQLDMWVYINDVARRMSDNTNRVVDILFTNGRYAIWHDIEVARWRFQIQGSSSSLYGDISDSYTPDGWHLFTILWDREGDYAKFIIDGSQVATINTPPFPSGNVTGIYVAGYVDNSGYLNTPVDSIRILDTPMEDADIAGYYVSNEPFSWNANTRTLLQFDGDLSGIVPYCATLSGTPGELSKYVDVSDPNNPKLHVMVHSRYPTAGAGQASVIRSDYVQLEVDADRTKNPVLITKKNLIEDPGFEKGGMGWINISGKLYTAHVYDGEYCVKSCYSDPVKITIPITPRRYYAISVMARVLDTPISGINGPFFIRWVKDAVGNEVGTAYPTNQDITTDWARYTIISRAHSQANRMRLELRPWSVYDEWILIDNVIVREVASADADLPPYSDEAWKTLELTDTLADNDVVALYTDKRKAKKNGTNNINDVNTAYLLQGFPVEGGENIMELNDDNESVHLYKAVLKYWPKSV